MPVVRSLPPSLYAAATSWLSESWAVRYPLADANGYVLSPLRGWLIGSLCVFMLVAGVFTNNAHADDPYREQLTTLADKCAELGLAEQAVISRNWSIDRDPERQYLFLPAESEKLSPPTDANELIKFWWQTFYRIRFERAADLFKQSEAAVAAGESARAYNLLHEVLHEYPDHAQARAALGYRLVNDRWRQPGAETKVSQPRVALTTTAWPANSYWRIETAHYDIRTNLSAEAGEALGRRLETLYDVWRQLFLPYWNDTATLARWIDRGQPTRRSLVKHKVVLFASREQYVEQFRDTQPGAAMSLGIYFDRERTAFFFAGEDSAIATQYHEAGHQLFHEVGRAGSGIGEHDNFWIVEGAALYLESLRHYDGYATVGGFDADRLQFARYRALNEGFYLPLADLCTLGRAELQQHVNIRQLYSQSAGLAHFLLDYEGGKYRRVADRYLQLVYDDRADRGTLAKLADVDLAQLDREYRDFLNVTDADLAHLAPSAHVRRLTLGHTPVTDAGLKHLAGYDGLIWLDLTGRPITDAGFASLAKATSLEQLSLDRTLVGDVSLPIIGRMRGLTELDLSGTKVTTAGLDHLAGLGQLESLWLTDTKLGDDAVGPLSKLKSLSYLNVSGAGVSADAWQRLKGMLPELDQ